MFCLPLRLFEMFRFQFSFLVSRLIFRSFLVVSRFSRFVIWLIDYDQRICSIVSTSHHRQEILKTHNNRLTIFFKTMVNWKKIGKIFNKNTNLPKNRRKNTKIELIDLVNWWWLKEISFFEIIHIFVLFVIILCNFNISYKFCRIFC